MAQRTTDILKDAEEATDVGIFNMGRKTIQIKGLMTKLQADTSPENKTVQVKELATKPEPDVNLEGKIAQIAELMTKLRSDANLEGKIAQIAGLMTKPEFDTSLEERNPAGRTPSQKPFRHTFQARYHPEEKVIDIAETYEGQKAGFFLKDHADRLRAMGASPDADFSYLWTLPYSAENWAEAMYFIRDTDELLEPDRRMYGMCWHCGVVSGGSVCPHCGRRTQTWYDADLKVKRVSAREALAQAVNLSAGGKNAIDDESGFVRVVAEAGDAGVRLPG